MCVCVRECVREKERGVVHVFDFLLKLSQCLLLVLLLIFLTVNTTER